MATVIAEVGQEAYELGVRALVVDDEARVDLDGPAGAIDRHGLHVATDRPLRVVQDDVVVLAHGVGGRETADASADENDDYRVPGGQSGYSVFQPIQSLGPNSEQVVKSFNYPADPDQAGEVIRQYGYTGFDFLSLIDEETPLHIDFQDVEGNKYHQVITRKGGAFAPGPVESQAIGRAHASAN